ncbi:MAG: uncharacterized membrane protein (UPF0127 family) [Parasphingorhabdus sp.]|jgi:uncharacterized membrane protein (UPF0127 family)
MSSTIRIPSAGFVWFSLFCLLAATSAKSETRTTSVEIAGKTFLLEVAADPASRSQGLMNRDRIAENGGMLFLFDQPAKRNFWMKNCLVDMDILFLNDSGIVIHMTEMFAEPLKQESESNSQYHNRLKRYPSKFPSRYAIELKHGTSVKLSIRPGARVKFSEPLH